MKTYAIVFLLSLSSACVAMDSVREWPNKEYFDKKRVKEQQANDQSQKKLPPKEQKANPGKRTNK